jgi:Ser/Thr protein kinase RdoA (MazF antagonist)
VVRVHRHGYRSRAGPDAELEFLEVAGGRLPADGAVPQPRTDEDGERVVEVTDPTTGERCLCTALRWLDGDVLRPGGGLGPRAVGAVGRALAMVHEVGQDEPFVAGASVTVRRHPRRG